MVYKQVAILFSGADIIAWSHGFQESKVPLRKKFTTILHPVIRPGFFIFPCLFILLSIGQIFPENEGVFTLKTHQMFSVRATPENFENATVTGQFGFKFPSCV